MSARMRRLSVVIVCLSWAALGRAHAAAPGTPGRPELRAFWVDGFNDGFHTPAECDLLLARVRAAHMNAVFVEMRKRGDASYASHYEPWATDDRQHFDALAYLCRQAHAPGRPPVQVHAWLNVCAVGPDTLARLHPDWLSVSDAGTTDDGEDVKIDPGDPAAADWTCRVLLDVVRDYPIDGLHLDAIRYGGDGRTLGHWGYSAASVARYNDRYGTTGKPAWNDPRWMQWRRDQVTALVRRVSVMAHALRPHLIVSAATISWGDGPADDADYVAKSAAYTQVFADWRGWLRDGLLDLNCPMTYFDQSRRPACWQDWSDFIKGHQYGRVSALGVGTWINGIPGALAQIGSTRLSAGQGRPAAGVVLFSYAGTDTAQGQARQYDPAFYDSLKEVFPTDVPVPPMPWLDRPKTGSLIGTLLQGAALEPVDGVPVVASGPGGAFHAVSDGNGFFAFVGLPPGPYQLDFRPRSVRTAMFARFFVGVGVRAGPSLMPLLFLPPVPGYRDRHRAVDGIGRLPEGTREMLHSVLVCSGSGRLGSDFYVRGPGDHWPLRVHAPGLSPPTVAGDIVAVSGTLRHTPGGAVLDAAAVRLTGERLIRAPE